MGCGSVQLGEQRVHVYLNQRASSVILAGHCQVHVFVRALIIAARI